MMEIDRVSLRCGEQLTIKLLHPPLVDYGSKVGCWTNIKDRLVKGDLAEWLYTPYFIGKIEGEVVGSLSYWAPSQKPDVGLVEFVHTVEAHRRKGIGSALMAALVGKFREAGGLALYLCTVNPVAGSLYEKHGFTYFIGDGMRYLAPEADGFDQTYLSYSEDAVVREASWSDLPRLSVLYNHPEPRWLIKDYLTQSFRDTRYESHFVNLMVRIENENGGIFVLENENERVVGAAAFERLDTFHEQHIATLSFRVCPAYLHQTKDLLSAVVKRAGQLSIRTLQIHVAECDEDQKEILVTAGFSKEARLPDHLFDGDRPLDLLIYTRSLCDTIRPSREPGDYYGGRQTWQEERVHN